MTDLIGLDLASGIAPNLFTLSVQGRPIAELRFYGDSTLNERELRNVLSKCAGAFDDGCDYCSIKDGAMDDAAAGLKALVEKYPEIKGDAEAIASHLCEASQ